MKISTIIILICLTFGSYFNANASDQVTPFAGQYSLYYQELNNINLILTPSKENAQANTKNFTYLLKLHSEFKNFELQNGLKLINKVESGQPLSGDELYFFNKTIHLFSKFAQKINDFSKHFNNRKVFLNAKVTPKLEDRIALKNNLLFLNGQIQLVDHAIKMNIVYYQTNDNLRRIIKKSIASENADENKFQVNLVRIIEDSISTTKTNSFINKLNLMINLQNSDMQVIKNNPDLTYNFYELSQNEITSNILRGNFSYQIKFYESEDRAINVFNNMTNWLSSVFGNFSGSIKWRTGRLFENEAFEKKLISNLKPLDILLEKTPFILTDKFIPGHFGHAALYLGTKTQLQEIGMWNHPSIIPYQKDIEEGKTILEAVRSDVRLTSVKEFLNIDEVLITRKSNAHDSPESVYENYTRGFDQIGKPYDFNFDIETLDKIVCSELLYIVFGEVNWPTKFRLGRATISPDDLAEVNFYKDTKFNIEQYVIGDENKNVLKANKIELARELNYVLRSENGGPVIDENDPTNSFFKLSEKCYNVIKNLDANLIEKECKTTYTLKYYAENSVQERI